MKAIFTAILMAVLLSGCGLLQRKQPEERTVYKFIRVPVEMTEQVAIKQPPEAVAYSKMTADQQESLLALLIQEHMQSINMCNSRLYGIHDWSDKQLKIYEPVNP